MGLPELLIFIFLVGEEHQQGLGARPNKRRAEGLGGLKHRNREIP